MSYQVCTLNCPSCGAPVSLNDEACEYCSRPLIIRTFNSVNSMPLTDINKQTSMYNKAMSDVPEDKKVNLSAAYCYLKLKMYDKASSCFSKAIEDNFDDSEAFFYAAINELKGKRPFLAPKASIEKAEEYLNAAIMIEPKGIYYYLWAYIRNDFYLKKFLRVKPDYKELLSDAQSCGVSQTDVAELFGILGVARPPEL